MNLTPIHWAAIQESVSKRQKVFAYLDRRMPGVLDSRYNIDWFNAWAKTHPWVINEKVIQIPKLTNSDKNHQPCSEQRASLPVINGHSPVAMTPRTSLHDYEPTPTSTRTYYYDNHTMEKQKQTPSGKHAVHTPKLPSTPVTSRRVAFSDEHYSKAPVRNFINNITIVISCINLLLETIASDIY